MKQLILLLLLPWFSSAAGQDMAAVHQTIDTLTSRTMWGRGYTNDGMEKAAGYLSDQFRAAGLQPMDGKNYRQEFSYPVNTFPGKMELSINGKRLAPGKDFLIEPSSSGLTGKQISQEQTDSITFVSRKERLLLILQDKLTWGVSPRAEKYTAVLVAKAALSEKPVSVDADLENLVVPAFKTSNICGLVRGTAYPDSILLYSAHYDHLGGMGAQTYFPGANDNASGVTMLCRLAAYFAAHPQPYTVAFICFSGEEAGLLGSQFFTGHPLIPLADIRFMINMDMVGTGDTGITAVNATGYPKAFDLLKQLNDQGKYLPAVHSRGQAQNSDHFPFAAKGVPAFFIYTEGGIRAYHDVFDAAATLPLTSFQPLYQLLIGFGRGLMAH